MFKLAELFVDIVGRDAPLKGMLARTHGALNATVGHARRAGDGISQALATAFGVVGGNAVTMLAIGAVRGAQAIAGGLAGAVSAASDLNETLSKTGAVFGPDTEKVTGFAQQMADKFGLSKKEMLDAASMYGLITQGAGLAADASTEMSLSLTKLAADAASFYNLRMDEALEKIRAGLTGEAEPLKALGVMLSEDAVKAKALAMGFKDINNAAKVKARFALISEGLGAASGDLEKTASSPANMMRKLSGQLQNTAADLGLAIQPAFQAALGGVGRVVEGIVGYFQSNKQMFADWAAAGVGALEWVINKGYELKDAINSFAGSESAQLITGTLGAAWSWLGGAVATAVDTIIFAMQNWQGITELISVEIGAALTHAGEYFQWLMDSAGTVLSWFAENWPDVLRTALNASLAAFQNTFKNIVDLVSAAWDFINDPSKGFHFEPTALLEGFESSIKELPKIAAPALTDFTGEIDAALAKIGDKANAATRDKLKLSIPDAAAGGPGGPAREAKAPEELPKKEKRAAVTDLEGFFKSLQVAGLKNDAEAAAKKTAENTAKTAEGLAEVKQAITSGFREIKGGVPGVAS